MAKTAHLPPNSTPTTPSIAPVIVVVIAAYKCCYAALITTITPSTTAAIEALYFWGGYGGGVPGPEQSEGGGGCIRHKKRFYWPQECFISYFSGPQQEYWININPVCFTQSLVLFHIKMLSKQQIFGTYSGARIIGFSFLHDNSHTPSNNNRYYKAFASLRPILSIIIKGGCYYRARIQAPH